MEGKVELKWKRNPEETWDHVLARIAFSITEREHAGLAHFIGGLIDGKPDDMATEELLDETVNLENLENDYELEGTEYLKFESTKDGLTYVLYASTDERLYLMCADLRPESREYGTYKIFRSA